MLNGWEKVVSAERDVARKVMGTLGRTINAGGNDMWNYIAIVISHFIFVVSVSISCRIYHCPVKFMSILSWCRHVYYFCVGKELSLFLFPWNPVGKDLLLNHSSLLFESFHIISMSLKSRERVMEPLVVSTAKDSDFFSMGNRKFFSNTSGIREGIWGEH